MGICWSCHWGWPEPVAEIYFRALSDLDGDESPLKFGPAHIVWEDENFESAEWCIEHFDEYRFDHSPADLEIVLRSLKELTALPLSVRCVEPEDYNDDEHPDHRPEDFPPPLGMRMIRV